VTLEDLLEALVGEIADEDDVLPLPRTPEGDMLDVDGSVSASTVADHFAVQLPAVAAVSFAGLVAELAGRIPMVGERFTVRDLVVDVLQASPTRIEHMLVRRLGAPAIRLDRAP
jgi:CBS domain containing-hemolysin-like protein